MKRTAVLFLYLLVILSGCAVTGPSIKYYEKHDSSTWLKNSVDKFKVYFKKIPAISDRHILVRVFSWNDAPNAFVNFDNRYIIISISDSLLPYLAGNNIYCLLAHEWAHVELNHQGTQLGTSALITTAFFLAECAAPGYGIGLFDPLAQSVVVTAYSRKDELEADARAMDYLAELGVSSSEFVEFLKLIKSMEPSVCRGGGIFDDHPDFNERIVAIESKKVTVRSSVPNIGEGTIQEDTRTIDRELTKLHEIKERFPFDIGPYGETKATKLTNGMTEQDVQKLFDGYRPNNKKILNNEIIAWIYNIPRTEYCFFILFKKDIDAVNKVMDFTIDLNDKEVNETAISSHNK